MLGEALVWKWRAGKLYQTYRRTGDIMIKVLLGEALRKMHAALEEYRAVEYNYDRKM